MSRISVYNMEGEKVGTVTLKDEIFGVDVNEHLVHMAVVAQLANKRQGTQKAKTRSEVSGGGRKPWRQKGTGHARMKLNRKEKKAALKSALTSRVQEKKFVVVDEIKAEEIKTKTMAKMFENLKVDKALLVLEEGNDNARISARNLKDVKCAAPNTINVYDILKYDTVVASKAALKKIEEVYA